MNDMASGMGSFILPALVAAAVIFALILWFFVNRASVRASEKVALLEALLHEQKKQNALLKRLLETQYVEDGVAAPTAPIAEPAVEEVPEPENPYLKFVPER
ncbi:YebO family protein [Tatumella saanichensis]|uniref:YebO family protein n=1 Tax=Tatumella saanichensis TaxID=480813 RepID=UPI0004A4B643|nr:YebO family protein [Tatumella saanichensis]